MNISLFLKIIGIIIVIYLIIVFYVYSKQRSLLYVPNIDNYDRIHIIRNIDNNDSSGWSSVENKERVRKINLSEEYVGSNAKKSDTNCSKLHLAVL